MHFFLYKNKSKRQKSKVFAINFTTCKYYFLPRVTISKKEFYVIFKHTNKKKKRINVSRSGTFPKFIVFLHKNTYDKKNTVHKSKSTAQKI